MGRKIGFAAVFTDITKRGALPEESSIHTAKMTTNKVSLKEIHKKRRQKIGNIKIKK